MIEIITRIPDADVSGGSVRITVSVEFASASALLEDAAPAIPAAVDSSRFRLAGGRELPPLLFVTSAQGLAANIGSAETALVLSALRDAGHAVLDSLPPGVTGQQAASLVQVRLAQSPDVKGVVLLGGYDLIPPMRLDAIDPALRAQLPPQLPPRGDMDNFIVWSDYAYSDVNGDGLSELPVSRIPDGSSSKLVFAALQAGRAPTGNAWQGLRNYARPFADVVYAPFALGAPMATSKDVVFHQSPAFDLRADRLYLMLHGSRQDGSRFWGEGDTGHLEAMNLSNVPEHGGSVVFTGCCWGALAANKTAHDAVAGQPVGARTPGNSLALGFLQAGVAAFIGCTGSHYSPFDLTTISGTRCTPPFGTGWKRAVHQRRRCSRRKPTISPAFPMGRRHSRARPSS